MDKRGGNKSTKTNDGQTKQTPILMRKKKLYRTSEVRTSNLRQLLQTGPKFQSKGMTSLSTNARPYLLPRRNNLECIHSKQHFAIYFDKDLRRLWLGPYSTHADSNHFQNGLGAFAQTRSRLRYASSDVTRNTSCQSVSYIFLAITKQREEMGIDDHQCVFYWTDHTYHDN
jgi:hypothetical protein